MIRKATLLDIDPILEITKSCATHMIDQGIQQWNQFYPNRNVFSNDEKRNELFVLVAHQTILGCIVISTLMDDEYESVKWQTPNTNNIYIHRVAINPSFQGKGYAQQLMSFAEQYAIDNNYDSIRLDTFSQNKRNQKFYELRGYKKLGDIYFPNQSEHPFYCYELVL